MEISLCGHRNLDLTSSIEVRFHLTKRVPYLVVLWSHMEHRGNSMFIWARLLDCIPFWLAYKLNIFSCPSNSVTELGSILGFWCVFIGRHTMMPRYECGRGRGLLDACVVSVWHGYIGLVEVSGFQGSTWMHWACRNTRVSADMANSLFIRLIICCNDQYFSFFFNNFNSICLLFS